MLTKAVLTVLIAGGMVFAAGLEPLSSAEICGRCHRSILDAWKSSVHSKAMESPLFQQALEVSEAQFGAASRKVCLACHAPVAMLANDPALRRKVSWEGVTCEYCHSLRDVSIAGGNPKAHVEFSLVKSGPIKDSVAPVHGTLFSPIHTSSLACAPCHEYRNSLGFPVLTTYAEWKDSRYAKEGKTCQWCHMSKVAGNVVDPKIRKSSHAKVNLHLMPGSHSLDMLNKTITARLTTVREKAQMKVSVQVANVAAGHHVPTGSPMRQLILEVRASSYDGQSFREERRYGRTVADAKGKVLTVEPAVLLRGARVVSDTRLGPDERRVETFTFPIPEGVQTQVQVALQYYYSPLASPESQKSVPFRTIQRLVK